MPFTFGSQSNPSMTRAERRRAEREARKAAKKERPLAKAASWTAPSQRARARLRLKCCSWRLRQRLLFSHTRELRAGIPAHASTSPVRGLRLASGSDGHGSSMPAVSHRTDSFSAQDCEPFSCNVTRTAR